MATLSSIFLGYIIPIIFVFGLINTLHGIVNYAIIGRNGDEERAEIGRHRLVLAIVLFAVGCGLYLFIQGLEWFLSRLSEEIPSERIEQYEDVRPVPNVPESNT